MQPLIQNQKFDYSRYNTLRWKPMATWCFSSGKLFAKQWTERKREKVKNLLMLLMCFRVRWDVCGQRGDWSPTCLINRTCLDLDRSNSLRIRGIFYWFPFGRFWKANLMVDLCSSKFDLRGSMGYHIESSTRNQRRAPERLAHLGSLIIWHDGSRFCYRFHWTIS